MTSSPRIHSRERSRVIRLTRIREIAKELLRMEAIILTPETSPLFEELHNLLNIKLGRPKKLTDS